jgi:hypothetical protein
MPDVIEVEFHRKAVCDFQLGRLVRATAMALVCL